MLRSILIITAGFVWSGCGPTAQESGQAVLLTAPLITIIGAAMAALYCHLWRPLAENLYFSWRLSLAAIATQIAIVTGVFLIVGCSLDARDLGNWVLITIWAVGSSYLAMQLISIRLALGPRLRKHYSSMSLLPWLLLYPPAIFLGYLGSDSEVSSIPLSLWVLPGYGGIIPFVLLTILGIEIAIRRYKLAQSKRAPAYPAPLPKAQAHIKRQ